MPTVPLAFPLSSNPARFGYGGAARLVNVYAEKQGQDARSEWAWHACDGLADFATLTGGDGVRAMLALSDSDLYAVAGRVLFRVDGTGTASILGGISSDGLVTMARNRVGQIAIVCDGLYWGVEAGVLSPLSDPDLPPPTSVTHLDGYFIFLLSDGRFFISTIDDWDVDALDTATAEANPDGGVRAVTRGRDLVLFGARSTEFWANTGAEFPFDRTTANDLGCKAAGSVVELEQTLFWVAHDGTVRVLDGYQGRKISSHAVERFIAEEETPSEITGCAWQSRGHSFYCISGENGSWCYDVTTGQWHERETYDHTRWIVSQTIQFGNMVIAGDYLTGALYDMSPDYLDEAGTELVTIIQPAPVLAGTKRVRHNALHIDLVPGTGLVSATDYLANPKVLLSYSDDGGASWSTERQIASGAAGQRLRRVFAHRLGISRSRTYQIKMSAAIARGFYGATADIDVMGN